ncbi:MAG: sulfotransferase, partial [Deltaproteobacteria bacterium]|nr:sulfotransferase [Deltaproteobacteria bacterium]
MPSPRKTIRAARALLRKGRLQAAQAKFDEVLALAPQHAEALHGRGQVALAARAGEEALEWLSRALRASPDAPDMLHSMGQALLLVERGTEAVRALEASLGRRPGDKATLATLKRARRWVDQAESPAGPGSGEPLGPARQLLAHGRIEEAVAAFERAVAQRPEDGPRHHELGNAWLQDGRLDRAERAHREGLRLAAANARGWLGLGEVLSAAGRRDEAEQAHREALRIDPYFGQAWLRVVQLRRYQAGDDDDLRALRRLVDSPGLDALDHEAAHFALAKIYEDLGEPDAVFRHLRQANELHQSRLPFDVTPLLQLMERIEKVCDAELFARFEGWGSTSETPVFIVGLPRCGSTLVEQIIASHPEAYGVGELRLLARQTGDLPARLGASLPFPDCLAQLDRQTVRGLADDYLRRLTRDAGDEARRICDKMLSHVLLVGLIAVLFPRARVIHCQRNLMD